MATFIISLLISLILVFPNSLFITFCILFVSVYRLYNLVSCGFLITLTIIMLCIVYVGAMIILIGYICAICPNLNLTSALGVFPFVILSFLISYTSPSFVYYSPFLTCMSILDYMYCGDGLYMFILIVLMLFVTLLMVTSQYLVPKGPFRSTV